MTPELLRALFPLTARRHAVALARVALHLATSLVIVFATLTASDDDLEGY